MSGKDRGKTGKVLRVDIEAGKLLVEGLNTVKKHIRPKKQGEKGQMIAMPQPLYISKVMLFCSSCGKGVRTRSRISDNKSANVIVKERVCVKCGSTI